jgi:hypothetical protein
MARVRTRHLGIGAGIGSGPRIDCAIAATVYCGLWAESGSADRFARPVEPGRGLASSAAAGGRRGSSGRGPPSATLVGAPQGHRNFRCNLTLLMRDGSETKMREIRGYFFEFDGRGRNLSNKMQRPIAGS